MQTLDVALGLVFVYLMLSLACTAANELLSQWFNSRATTLRQGIDALLCHVVNASTPDLIAALESAEAAADKARRESEAALRSAAPELYDAWMVAERAADDATLVYEQVCVRTRSVQHFELTGTAGHIPELDGERADTAVGAARLRLDATVAARTDAERALRTAASALFATLQQQRLNANEAAAAHRLATVYDHPLIAGLSQLPWRLLPWDKHVRLPSYIPTQTFVYALVDQIAPAASASPTPLLEVRRAIRAMPDHVQRPILLALNESAGDLDTFRNALGTWFDNTMERVSGLYKRKTKLTVLMFAVLVTLFTNADTIRIVRAISSNKVLRETLVAQAENASSAGSLDTLGTSFAESIGRMQSLGIPIGYAMPDSVRQLLPRAAWLGERRVVANPAIGDSIARVIPSRTRLYLSVYLPQLRSGFVGLLLTALALSLGAPFWFDILNKIVNVRAVGRAPAENAKERAESTAKSSAKR